MKIEIREGEQERKTTFSLLFVFFKSAVLLGDCCSGGGEISRALFSRKDMRGGRRVHAN